jgi:hypothetical protein
LGTLLGQGKVRAFAQTGKTLRMALRRPLIAGFGTTGLLVAFAALLLVVVGALLGFRGWPGNGSVGDAGGVSIKDARLTNFAPVTLPAVKADAFAATASPAAPRHGKRSHGRRARDAQGVAGERRSSGQQPEPAAGGGAGSGGSPGRSSGSNTQPGRSSGSSTQPGVTSVSDGVANTVKGVTETAGGSLGGDSTPVGKVVLDTGNAVSKTVQQLGVDAQGKAAALP